MPVSARRRRFQAWVAGWSTSKTFTSCGERAAIGEGVEAGTEDDALADAAAYRGGERVLAIAAPRDEKRAHVAANRALMAPRMGADIRLGRRSDDLQARPDRRRSSDRRGAGGRRGGGQRARRSNWACRFSMSRSRQMLNSLPVTPRARESARRCGSAAMRRVSGPAAARRGWAARPAFRAGRAARRCRNECRRRRRHGEGAAGPDRSGRRPASGPDRGWPRREEGRSSRPS